MYLLAEEKEWY